MHSENLLSHRQIVSLYLGFLAVYISGLFIPLMENDSAQHASMAIRMALSGDFLDIFKGENPYLDKPHLHFWLAALSMKLFGINAVAYRIPALLCLALGAFSTKKLTDLLYGNSNLSYVASLIFLSAQTIILSAHDVRTDAVLTGFIIFSVWQFVKFIQSQKISAAVFAGLGAALAFSAKGQMAIVIIGFCIFSYLLYSRVWKRFFNLKIIAAVVAFFVGIFPVLLAYHHQFGMEGVRFILFNQSLNRLNANGFKETSPDYLFFFHTLLWAFLPFSVPFYTGVFEKSFWFFKNKFKKESGAEFLTLGGFWLVMLLFSLSKFKLPHYLNGLIAIISIFTAAYLFEIFRKNQVKKIRVFWIIQLVVIFAAIVGLGLLAVYFTGIPNVAMFILTVLAFCFLLNKIFIRENLFRKYVFVSLLFAIALNLFLNTQFYPVLTQYQGSLKLAKFVNENHLNKNKIFVLTGDESWNFDFYTKRNTPRIDENQLKKDDILLLSDEQLQDFHRKFEIIKTESSFRITRLSLKFLNPKTRGEKLTKMYLVKILD